VLTRRVRGRIIRGRPTLDRRFVGLRGEDFLVDRFGRIVRCRTGNGVFGHVFPRAVGGHRCDAAVRPRYSAKFRAAVRDLFGNPFRAIL
jgi:hypothetical protein